MVNYSFKRVWNNIWWCKSLCWSLLSEKVRFEVNQLWIYMLHFTSKCLIMQVWIGWSSHIITTPTYSNAHLNKISHEVNDDQEEDLPYQEVVGSFMFVVIGSHLDIVCAIKMVTTFSQNPKNTLIWTTTYSFCYWYGENRNELTSILSKTWLCPWLGQKKVKKWMCLDAQTRSYIMY
jgi:hypothetical protein